MLRLSEDRRQIYYGGKKRPNIKKFLCDCNAMKVNRQVRDFERLQYLYRLYRMIELRRKFKDWDLYVKVKHITRRHRLKFSMEEWRKRAILKKSVEFYDITLKRKAMVALKKWVFVMKMKRLKDAYDRWLTYLDMRRMIKSMKSLLKCFPLAAFQHWKTLTFQQVNMKPVVEKIRLRLLSEHFAFLRQRADELIEERLLSGLKIVEENVEVVLADVVPAPVKKKRTIRKAPLDNMLTTCDCVSKVCHGHRPNCSFKVHFRRRLNLCYQEYDLAIEDKKIAKAMDHFKPPSPGISSPNSSVILPASPSAFEGNINPRRSFRGQQQPMSPERKRKIVKDKVRGGMMRNSEKMSHWPPNLLRRSSKTDNEGSDGGEEEKDDEKHCAGNQGDDIDRSVIDVLTASTPSIDDYEGDFE